VCHHMITSRFPIGTGHQIEIKISLLGVGVLVVVFS
jgi:hypothetical protein